MHTLPLFTKDNNKHYKGGKEERRYTRKYIL